VPEDLPSRDDLAAAVGARRELGPEYEDAVIDSFVAGVERRIDQRVDAKVAERVSAAALGSPTTSSGGRDPSPALGLVSLGAGIPITAIATSNGGLVALAISWAGIAAVNIAAAWGRRRDR